MYINQRIKARIRKRQALGGLSSRPYGPPTSMIALSGISGTGRTTRNIMYSGPMTVNGPQLQGPPDWYRAMNGAGLGDDTPASTPVLTDGMTEWQKSMLSETQAMVDAQIEFTKNESFQRWIQIAATLAIPLSAAVWRMIFKSGE